MISGVYPVFFWSSKFLTSFYSTEEAHRLGGYNYHNLNALIPAEHLREVADRSQRIVETLARNFPSRTGMYGSNLARAAAWIEQEFLSLGYTVAFHRYASYPEGEVKNLVVGKPGSDRKSSAIVIGAHYDSVEATPGADDNASGVAGLLELARLLRDYENRKTLQFVAFTHEEPPYFYTSRMGSYVYARSLRQSHVQLDAMICLEMIGYGGEHLRQTYPLPLMRQIGGYPRSGDFVGIVGNLRSRRLTRFIRDHMQQACSIGVASLSVPAFLPPFNLSDHSSFWRHGYRAVMITDTAFQRNPHYHLPSDSAETLNYDFLAEVVRGLYHAVRALDVAP